MLIADIRHNHIIPFEIDDVRLMRIFGFLLHSAPTINSDTAIVIVPERLERNWKKFISEMSNDSYTFLTPNVTLEKYLECYGLHDGVNVNRKSKGFICKRKDNKESDYECVLRHLRNAIAHSHVYVSNTGNRKYILLEDFNQSGNQSSIMLFSQSDLTRLKNCIVS